MSDTNTPNLDQNAITKAIRAFLEQKGFMPKEPRHPVDEWTVKLNASFVSYMFLVCGVARGRITVPTTYSAVHPSIQSKPEWQAIVNALCSEEESQVKTTVNLDRDEEEEETQSQTSGEGVDPDQFGANANATDVSTASVTETAVAATTESSQVNTGDGETVAANTQDASVDGEATVVATASVESTIDTSTDGTEDKAEVDAASESQASGAAVAPKE
jgi:hypothetical protein